MFSEITATSSSNGLVVFDQGLNLVLLAIGGWWLWRSPGSFFAVCVGLLVWWEANVADHSPVPWLVVGALVLARKLGAVVRWVLSPTRAGRVGGW